MPLVDTGSLRQPTGFAHQTFKGFKQVAGLRDLGLELTERLISAPLRIIDGALTLQGVR